MAEQPTLVLDMAHADAQTAQAIAMAEKLAGYLHQEAQAVTGAASSVPATGASIKEPDAWRALGAQAGAPWESIEQSRRRIVALAHPDRLATMPAQQQAKARADAETANAAYLFLHSLRIGAQ